MARNPTAVVAVYQWANGAHLKNLDAQKVGEEVNAVRKRKGDELKPEDIVEAARKNKTSPLHTYFIWEDEAAAVLYRREQAKYVIRNLRVEYERPDTHENITVQAFINVESNQRKRYVTINDALNDPEYREQMLAEALRELDSWHHRYSLYQELDGIMAAAEQVRESHLEAAQ